MDPLQSLDSASLMPEQQAILHMLKGALEYPASNEARASKIVNDTVFCCTDFDSRVEDVGCVFMHLWHLIIDLGCCLPSGNEWQDIPVLAIDTIRRRDGIVDEDEPGYIWSDLPDLTMYLSEHWQYHAIGDYPQSSSDYDPWKNINSFISRLGGSGYTAVLNLGIWEIRQALEDPVTDPKILLNCSLWVSSEWIIRCNMPLFQLMTLPKDPGDEPISTEFTGPLYGEGLPPWTLDRWEFWKKRLTFFAAESESHGLEYETKKHIEEALKVM
ncbi:hypothetical protein B0I35DRAFT_484525 [Stachybotrys elegans]|uniref:Uncharacterized protein n=1 Tax=Stachybotrys elegans TaxID=80388 RepID=A0A8K0SD16_9HYPO|nr:hypothetical protein B0I35DRAFT_484525 [Stachybotrys elegans]